MSRINIQAILLAFFLAIAGFLIGCKPTIEIPTDFPTPEPPPKATPLPKIELHADAELEKKIADIAKEAKGKVGVAAVVIDTGESASLNAGDHFPMQSVYKLPISMAVVEKFRQEDRGLDELVGVTKDDMVRQGQASPLRDKNPNGSEFTVRELIRLALVESDGTASDVLIRVAGGPDVVQSYLTQIGIQDMKVVNTEKEIGRDWETQFQNWATPAAAAELLRWLNASAGNWKPPNKDEELDGTKSILQLMIQSTTGANRLKGLVQIKDGLPVVAHKTGTSGTQNGVTAATNDIGLMYLPNGRRVVIAVFVSDSPADERNREAVIAKIAKAVWDKWAKKT